MLQAFNAAVAGGFTNSEAERALESLFGVTFTVHQVSPLPSKATGVTPAILASETSVRDQFLADLVAKQQQMLLHIWWGGAPDYNGAHAVLAVRRENGAVIFKNPQYPGSKPVPGAVAGGTDSGPPRRYVDPSQALESMTESDLTNWVLAYFAPDAAII
jgi:hypothetical protein